jgi:hypothetical protein
LQWPDIRTSRNKWVHTLNNADVIRSADAFFVFCPQSSSFPCYCSRSHSTRSRNRLTGRWDSQLSHEFVGGRGRVFRFPFASRFCRFYFQSANFTYNRTICPTGLDHLVIFLACKPHIRNKSWGRSSPASYIVVSSRCSLCSLVRYYIVPCSRHTLLQRLCTTIYVLRRICCAIWSSVSAMAINITSPWGRGARHHNKYLLGDTQLSLTCQEKPLPPTMFESSQCG